MSCKVETTFGETPDTVARNIGASKAQIRELSRFVEHCKAVSFADVTKLTITAGTNGSLDVMAVYTQEGKVEQYCAIEWARDGKLLDVCFS